MVLECPLYSNERAHLLSHINSIFYNFTYLEEKTQFILLMGSTDIEIIDAFSKFVHKCMYIHEQFNL